MNRTRVLLLLSTLIFLTSTAIVYASGGGVVPCDGPDCRACDIITLGQNLLTWFIGIMAAIIALMFAWGGMEMVMSAGNASMVSSGREKMSNAIIGLIIILASWLIVNTFILVISGGNLSNWGQIQCVANPARTTSMGSGVGSVTGVSGSKVTAGKITDADARELLTSAGIGVNKSMEQGTSLEGMNIETVQNAIALKRACNCDITITAGTESTGGHASGAVSHGSGNKYDMRINPTLDNYIKTTYTPSGTRSNGDALYTAPDGSVYAYEQSASGGPHWDVLVK